MRSLDAGDVEPYVDAAGLSAGDHVVDVKVRPVQGMIGGIDCAANRAAEDIDNREAIRDRWNSWASRRTAARAAHDQPSRRGARAGAVGQRRCRPCESRAHRPRHARVRRVDRAGAGARRRRRAGGRSSAPASSRRRRVAYLTRSEGFDAGIVISASHNPYEDNGIKIFSGQRREARRIARSAASRRWSRTSPGR